MKDTTEIVSKLKKRLERLTDMKNKLEKEHIGKEYDFTYWGGFDLGYLKGKITEIEDMIDELS